MKISFNNFFKLKNKRKKRIVEPKKDVPVLKVYSKGQIIKYTPNKVGYNRNGANNLNNVLIYENKKELNVNNKKKEESKPKRKNSYFLFCGMLVLAGYSLYFSYSRYKLLNEEDYAVYNSEDVQTEIILPEEQSSVSNNLDTIQKQEITKKVISTQKPEVKKVEPLSFAKPIEGEILKIYSIDKVIYSKTLELWKTHDGIDIKADENTVVKAIEKGTVEKIYDDSFYGKTIVIDHGQGYKSSYSNLSEEVFVKEKQVVTKLGKIGKVGKTAIGEIKDESHLHFTLLKNNEICDPSSIFK